MADFKEENIVNFASDRSYPVEDAMVMLLGLVK